LTDGGQVEDHYATEGITARVLTALRNVNGPGRKLAECAALFRPMAIPCVRNAG